MTGANKPQLLCFRRVIDGMKLVALLATWITMWLKTGLSLL